MSALDPGGVVAKFEDDLRWRNLLRILGAHLFTVEITLTTTTEGVECEGLLVMRPNHPFIEIFTTPGRAAEDVLAELHGHQLLIGFTVEDLDRPDSESAGSDEDECPDEGDDDERHGDAEDDT